MDSIGAKRGLFNISDLPPEPQDSPAPAAQREHAIALEVLEGSAVSQSTPKRIRRRSNPIAARTKKGLPKVNIAHGAMHFPGDRQIPVTFFAKGQIHNVWELKGSQAISQLELSDQNARGLFYRWMQAGTPKLLMKTLQASHGRPDQLLYARRTANALEQYNREAFRVQGIRVAKHLTNIFETGYWLVERIDGGEIDRTVYGPGTVMERIRRMLEAMVRDPETYRIDDAVPDNLRIDASNYLVLIDPDYEGHLSLSDEDDVEDLAIKFERLFLCWAGADITENGTMDMSGLKPELLEYLTQNLLDDTGPVWKLLEPRLFQN